MKREGTGSRNFNAYGSHCFWHAFGSQNANELFPRRLSSVPGAISGDRGFTCDRSVSIGLRAFRPCSAPHPFPGEKTTLKSRTAALLKHWRIVLPCALACFVILNFVIELRPGMRTARTIGDPARRQALDAESRVQAAIDALSQASNRKIGEGCRSQKGVYCLG